MKKLLCMWMLVFFYITSIAAQDSISVSYEYSQDNFLRQLMNFQGIYGINVIVKGCPKETPYQLYMVRNTEGKTERKRIDPGFFSMRDSIQSLYFFAQAESADTLHINCSSIDLHIPIATKNCILLETLPIKAYNIADTIPLIAYSTGKKMELELNGETVEAIDFCGVRYSNTHPSEWYNKFNIKDYLYFELELHPQKEE